MQESKPYPKGASKSAKNTLPGVAEAKVSGSYHHGNLKQALVGNYITLLESTPPEKLSIRKLAAHLGVAPTAVYNHFADKDALIAAVKLRCLEHLTAYLEASSSPSMEPEEQIQAIGQAYFQYSKDHVQYFERIFQDEVPEEYVTEELINASMAAERALRSAVIALLEKHNLPSGQYNEGLGTFACWSMTHGITLLAAKHVNHAACLTGRWPKEFMLNDRDSLKASFIAMTDVLVAGILSAAKKNHE